MNAGLKYVVCIYCHNLYHSAITAFFHYKNCLTNSSGIRFYLNTFTTSHYMKNSIKQIYFDFTASHDEHSLCCVRNKYVLLLKAFLLLKIHRKFVELRWNFDVFYSSGKVDGGFLEIWLSSKIYEWWIAKNISGTVFVAFFLDKLDHEKKRARLYLKWEFIA